MKFSPATLTLTATVLGGFALAALQGYSCSGSPSINNTVIVCVSADQGGDCDNTAQNGAGGIAAPTPQAGPGSFDDPLAGVSCSTQYDCFTDQPLDQCLRAACVNGECKTVINSFAACTPYGLWCAAGECMPAPESWTYPAYCAFNQNFESLGYGPTIAPGTCLLDNQCFAEGEPNPANPCEVCAPVAGGRGEWDPLANDTECSQFGFPGTCQAGVRVLDEEETTNTTGGDEGTTGDEPDDTTGGSTTDTAGTTGDDTDTDTSGTDTSGATGTTTTDGGTSDADAGTGAETTGDDTTGDETGDATTGA